MKRIYLISAVLMVFSACTPVLNRAVMNQGKRDVPFDQLRGAPMSSRESSLSSAA